MLGKFNKRPWDNLFDGNICLGEDHSDITPKKFIIENLALLKAKGYDCIFIEHLSRREHQALLDEFFISKTMDPYLNEYLDDLNEGHMISHEREKINQTKIYNFKIIIIEAAKIGIRIIALEESLALYRHPNYEQGANRMLILNSLCIDRVAALKKECGNIELKWLALVGSGHVNTRENIPGVADVVNCQDLIIRDINNNQIEYLKSTDTKQFFKIGQGSDSNDDLPEQEKSGYLASMVLNKKWHNSSMKFADNLALPATDQIAPMPNVLSLAKNPTGVDFGSAGDLSSEDKFGTPPKIHAGKRIARPAENASLDKTNNR